MRRRVRKPTKFSPRLLLEEAAQVDRAQEDVVGHRLQADGPGVVVLLDELWAFLTALCSGRPACSETRAMSRPRSSPVPAPDLPGRAQQVRSSSRREPAPPRRVPREEPLERDAVLLQGALEQGDQVDDCVAHPVRYRAVEPREDRVEQSIAARRPPARWRRRGASAARAGPFGSSVLWASDTGRGGQLARSAAATASAKAEALRCATAAPGPDRKPEGASSIPSRGRLIFASTSRASSRAVARARVQHAQDHFADRDEVQGGVHLEIRRALGVVGLSSPAPRGGRTRGHSRRSLRGGPPHRADRQLRRACPGPDRSARDAARLGGARSAPRRRSEKRLAREQRLRVLWSSRSFR